MSTWDLPPPVHMRPPEPDPSPLRLDVINGWPHSNSLPCLLEHNNFELLSSPRGPLTILAVYRPGSSLPSLTFFEEFATMLEQFALYNTQLVITGDINLHLEDPTLPATVQFQAMIEQFGLTQHVAESTHRSDGWL